MFDDWARAHPDVQLRVSVMPGLELHKAKLQLAAAAGRLPDVASIDSFWLPLLTDDVQPLDAYWPAEDRADFLPFTIQTLSDPAGHVYGLWHETDCRVLFYRKDLVPVPPRTWDELLDTASRVAREQHVAGYLYNAGRWEATVFDHLAMFWAQGGELVDRDGRPIFGEEPNRARDAPAARLPARHDSARRVAAIGARAQRLPAADRRRRRRRRRDVSRRQLAAEGSAEPGCRRPSSRSGTSRRFRRPTPATRSTGTGGWVWVVFARDPERQRAAIEFIRDVEAPAHAARISEATGHLPVRRSVYRDFPIFSQDPWYRRFGEMLVDGHARPTVADLPGDLAAAAARDRRRSCPARRRRSRRSTRRGRAVERRSTRARPRRTHGTRARGVDAIAWLPIARGGRVSARDVLARPRATRTRRRAWVLPAVALVTIILIYPMLDLLRLSLTDATVAGTRYTLHARELSRRCSPTASFYGMVGVTVIFVAGSVVAAADDRLRARVADRRRRGAGARRARSSRAWRWSARG